MKEQELREIIEEIIESNEIESEAIEYFDAYDLENKFKELDNNLDEFVSWVSEILDI